MRTSILTILGGVVLGGLVGACGGTKIDENSPAATAGKAGSESASAGTAGAFNAGAGGSSAAGTSGALGSAGGSGAGVAGADTSEAGEGGDSGDSGSGGTAGAGTGGTGGVVINTGGAAGYPTIDIGPQQTSDKLDVLFVVDNSVSMADKQNILRSSLPNFVNRLVNPLCVDAQGKPAATQPSSAAAACAGGTREMTPVSDLHLGVITTSIGSHGGSVCATATGANDHLDDQAELLPSHRDNLASYQGSGYLSFDTTGQAGVSDVGPVITDLQAMVAAAAETGCGYEAPLEAMYRFLVDPEPPVSVDLVGQESTPTGINSTLLTQRNSFLRPDSAVAVVILSDESDCSIMDSGVGWFVGSSARMPLSTAACATNPNDACCRSCAQNETTPPAGCSSLAQDSVCSTKAAGASYATWDALHDSLNLRCYNQHQRFGFDLLYPIERYSDALSNPMVHNRAQELVPNPLLAARDGKGPRSATMISVSLIIGAPWQDLASTASATAGHDIQYLGGAGLASNARWLLLLGDPKRSVPPTDPFMRESIAERSGVNPLVSLPIVPASSDDPTASPINGHEQNVPDFADLQYACTFALAESQPCGLGDAACDCSPSKTGDLSAVTAANSPLCQPPAGGPANSTQYYGKGYPGARELSFAQLLGARAVPASICPTNLVDDSSADFAYRPAFSALISRIAVTLK